MAHRFYEVLRELQALGAERTTDEVIFEHFTLMNHSAKAIELEDIEARGGVGALSSSVAHDVESSLGLDATSEHGMLQGFGQARMISSKDIVFTPGDRLKPGMEGRDRGRLASSSGRPDPPAIRNAAAVRSAIGELILGSSPGAVALGRLSLHPPKFPRPT